MAVNINTVYTTVLFILNKEQRGYIPPAEFNSLAQQAQIEIFESYFPDGNQFNRANQNNTQNNTEFFNMFKDNAYKLYPFESTVPFTISVPAEPDNWSPTPSRPLYRIGEIIATYNNTGANNESIVDLLSKQEYSITERSKLTAPTQLYPIGYLTNRTAAPISTSDPTLILRVSPRPDAVNANCILLPSQPIWGFTTGTLGQYVFDATSSKNFELDISEQTNLIINILKYAGVIIKDPEVVQLATQEAAKVEQNEKS